MVAGGLSQYFLNPSGLPFLALLIPLLLLYLIRPKPQRRAIPSLMFVLKDQGRNPINRMFRTFFRDFLLLIQFFIIFLAAISIAHPFINVAIIIIDVSASSQVGGRFNEIKERATETLADENTIILAQGFPEILVEGASASRAKKLIEDLEPKETTTNLADALKLASQRAGANTNVIIVSDFLPSEGTLDLEPQLKAIKTKGALVTPVVVGKPVANIGIIDLAIRDGTSRVWVKNYDDRPVEVMLAIGDIKQNIVLAKRETKDVSFTTPAGVTPLTLTPADAFPADNAAWISTPADNEIEMLVITNDRSAWEKSNLFLAFQLIDKNFPINIKMEYATPPKIPDLEHDIYLFSGANTEFLLPGVLKSLRSKVEQGGAVIITNQPGLFSIDWQGLLPLTYLEQGGAAEVRALKENLLTKDISFAQVTSQTKVKAAEGVSIIAAADDNPVITINKLGKGTVVYYGYLPGQESFSADNSFPVFWRRLLDLVTNRPSLANLNVRTGAVISLAKEEKIKTPSGTVTTQLLRAEHAGLYQFEDRTIAANLLSDLESNTNRPSAINMTEDGNGKEEEKQAPYDLATLALIVGLALVFLELLYIKFRGDL